MEFLITNSLDIALFNTSSIEDKPMSDGIKSTPSTFFIRALSGFIILSSITPFIKSAKVYFISSCLTPKQVVKFPCGSASINNTFLPSCAKAIPREIAVVVLPTPPF